MNKLYLALLASPAVAVLAASVYSYTTGALPGFTPPMGIQVPLNVAQAAPGCAFCHLQTPPPSPVVVSVTPAKRSLSAGEQIMVTTSIAGGIVHPQNWGGFCSQVSGGAFAAGATSQINANGSAVTHRNSFSGNRSWTYGYTAGATPGVVSMWVAGNTVNGDGFNTGDAFAFHGDTTGMSSVPVPLYVNAQNVVHHGVGCVGGGGKWSVLGALTPPQINTTFTLEAHGVVPSAGVTLFLGLNPTFSFDLTVIGITGCTLWVQQAAALGASANAAGVASWPIPFPNDPSLIGAKVECQAAYLDLASGRPLPVTLTNAVQFTIL